MATRVIFYGISIVGHVHTMVIAIVGHMCEMIITTCGHVNLF